MEKVLQKYSSKTPESLNRQFLDRLRKEEAVLSFKARKQKKKNHFFHQAQNKVSCSRILPVHQAVVGRQVAEDAPEKK
ncbi:hypothetical protein ACROYT_G004879 [Oculina patagonica]